MASIEVLLITEELNVGALTNERTPPVSASRITTEPRWSPNAR